MGSTQRGCGRLAGTLLGTRCGQERKDSGPATAGGGQPDQDLYFVTIAPRPILPGPVQSSTASARSNSDLGTRRGIKDGSTD
jgi:hypothetical protein